MIQISILIEPILAHAKFYEELAVACSDERRAWEFRQCAQRCIDAASTATAFGVSTLQLLISYGPELRVLWPNAAMTTGWRVAPESGGILRMDLKNTALGLSDHSGFRFANFTTLAHLSVSSAISLSTWRSANDLTHGLTYPPWHQASSRLRASRFLKTIRRDVGTSIAAAFSRLVSVRDTVSIVRPR